MVRYLGCCCLSNGHAFVVYPLTSLVGSVGFVVVIIAGASVILVGGVSTLCCPICVTLFVLVGKCMAGSVNPWGGAAIHE